MAAMTIVPHERQFCRTSRRSFISMGAAAATFLPAVADLAPTVQGKTEPTHDPWLSVFIADPHVPERGVPPEDPRDAAFPDQMYNRLAAIVDEILAMRPLPSSVVCFGDIAYLKGRVEEYKTTEPMLRRLEQAGIRLVLGLGNHDHRDAFLEVWPEYRTNTLVPGFVVSEVSLGTCDLVMLDTLWDSGVPGSYNRGEGNLQGAMLAFVENDLKKRKRPFLLAGHQSPDVIATGKEKLLHWVAKLDKCCGYVHGHNHAWKRSCVHVWYGSCPVKRVVALPSTGFWGDIGYALCRTSKDRATVELVQTDFYFPRYREDNRPALWANMVRENDGSTCEFLY